MRKISKLKEEKKENCYYSQHPIASFKLKLLEFNSPEYLKSHTKK